MKALCIFSGGLDSMLAAQLIRAQGIDVLGLFFETPFFSSLKARKSAHSMDLPVKIVDITERHLEVVKHPKHGHGGNMNPCIDCHALMFRIAGEMLEQEGANFALTGEVLGQRPMSQNKKSLSVIACESGIADLLLRPLSAKHLSPTLPEERGWISRDLLMDFQGRSRKPQMELAKKFNLTEYPAPAGGCLLTDKGFSKRLRDLLSLSPNHELREIELLKLGRHFRLSPGTKIVVGRNKRENEAIRSLSVGKDIILTSISVPGPTAVISGDSSEKTVELAASITAAYSDAQENDTLTVRAESGESRKLLVTGVRNKEEFRGYMV